MAQTKIEKIAGIEEQIQQLENQKKRLIQAQKEQDRKDRTRRLCKRAGLLESLLPDTIPLSDEQFKSFLEKTLLTDFTRRTLDTIAAQNTATAAPRPTETARESGGEREQDGGNGARVTG